MSRAVFEQIKYQATHTFPPVLDGLEILEDSKLISKKPGVVEEWVKYTRGFLNHDRYLTRTTKNIIEGKPFGLSTEGMDIYTSTLTVLNGTVRSRRRRMQVTNKVFRALQDGEQPQPRELRAAKHVVNDFYRKTTADLVF